ncbi:hypothetical protein [Streptomyces sp. NPDC059003]|uniref:hypothetical protein n=1 Tax=Streptomyces sp. NPDC059003 TaxID=3346691 RepID=UPI0036C1B64A
MTDTQVHIPIQARYAEQWAQELEDNLAQQRALDEQLARLRADAQWLQQRLAEQAPSSREQTLKEPAAAAATRAHGLAAGTPAEVPAPRAASLAKAPAEHSAAPGPARAAAAGKPKRKSITPARKAAKRAPAKAAAAPKKPQPGLRDLLWELLDGHHPEPRTVTEVAEQLEREHPERATSKQTVRNALNALVGQQRAEVDDRQKQLMYTSVRQAGQASQESEAAGAPDSAAEPEAAEGKPAAAV